MSLQTLNYRNNNSTDKEETGNEKILISRFQTQKTRKDNFSTITVGNEREKINKGKVYPYPILYHKERDPLSEFKLRIIKSKNKGDDTFLKNYLKFNFAKNDASNSIANNANIYNSTKMIQTKVYNDNSKISLLENSKNNLFITENMKIDLKLDNMKEKNTIDSNRSNIGKKYKSTSVITNKRLIKKSRSGIINPFSREALSQYRISYLHQMEKRGNMYNKIKIAQLQRIALKNFSSMSMNGNNYVNGSIPTGKSNESYILETKKRKKLPGIKDYICSRLKKMKNEELNTPEYYRERSKKYERNKLPELINIKNSGRFQFHVFHDQYGYIKELDKRGKTEFKMTKEKVRDLKVMQQINKTNDPEIIEFYRRAVYSS